MARSAAALACVVAALAVGALGGFAGARVAEAEYPAVPGFATVTMVLGVVATWSSTARLRVSAGLAVIVVILAGLIVTQLPASPPLATLLASALIPAIAVGGAVVACAYSARAVRLLSWSVIAAIANGLWALTAVNPAREPACLRVCEVVAAPVALMIPSRVAAGVATVLAVCVCALAIAAIVRCRRAAPSLLSIAGVIGAAVLALTAVLRFARWSNPGPIASDLLVPFVAAAPVIVVCTYYAVADSISRRAVARIAATLAAGSDQALLERVQFSTGESEWCDVWGRPVEERRDWLLVEHEKMPLARVAVRHDRGGVPELDATALLVIGNARLLALTRRETRDLRGAQRRIVRASDEEARRLERGLHDGVQQRLVSALFFLGAAAVDEGSPPPLRQAGNEIRDALGHLRDISHGIVPDEIVTDGVWPVLREAMGSRRIPVAWEARVEPELAADQAAALFFATVRCLEVAETDPEIVSARWETAVADGTLRGHLAFEGAPLDVERLGDASDRLGAAGGRLEIPSANVAEVILPCAS